MAVTAAVVVVMAVMVAMVLSNGRSLGKNTPRIPNMNAISTDSEGYVDVMGKDIIKKDKDVFTVKSGGKSTSHPWGGTEEPESRAEQDSVNGNRRISSQKELLTGLLRGYDVNEWPHFYYGKRTDVHVQMFINAFGSLNAARMEFRIDLFLRQRWQDPRLAYSDKREYLTVMDSEMQSKIWRPDTYFDNVKDARVHQVTLPNIMLRIGKMGDIMYSMRVALVLSCNMNYQDYPFDTQECTTVVSSIASTKDMVAYHWSDKTPIKIPEELQIAEFDLMENRTAETTLQFGTGNYSGLVARFTLRRQNGYHILQTYFPTILIVSVSWVSFWLDPTAIPGRVTLGVTTLLTLTTLASGVRQSLPPVNYVKAIDVWVGMCMFMVFGSLIEFTFSNWLAITKIKPSRGGEGGLGHSMKLPQCLGSSESYLAPLDDPDDVGGWGGIGATPPHKPAQNVPGSTEVFVAGRPSVRVKPTGPTTYIKQARTLDRLSRVIFPAIFLLFNIFYWPYYILMQYGENTRPAFTEH